MDATNTPEARAIASAKSAVIDAQQEPGLTPQAELHLQAAFRSLDMAWALSVMNSKVTA